MHGREGTRTWVRAPFSMSPGCRTALCPSESRGGAFPITPQGRCCPLQRRGPGVTAGGSQLGLTISRAVTGPAEDTELQPPPQTGRAPRAAALSTPHGPGGRRELPAAIFLPADGRWAVFSVPRDPHACGLRLETGRRAWDRWHGEVRASASARAFKEPRGRAEGLGRGRWPGPRAHRGAGGRHGDPGPSLSISELARRGCAHKPSNAISRLAMSPVNKPAPEAGWPEAGAQLVRVCACDAPRVVARSRGHLSPF